MTDEPRSRPILAQLHRGSETIWNRHYSVFSNAVRRATELALLDGEPGDVVEFSNEIGMQLGTLKLHVNGQITIAWSEGVNRINKVLSEILE